MVSPQIFSQPFPITSLDMSSCYDEPYWYAFEYYNASC